MQGICFGAGVMTYLTAGAQFYVGEPMAGAVCYLATGVFGVACAILEKKKP